MRITQVSLTNFKSFKTTQVIKFAPITLLFGPNSVGKSSVIMALAYLQQILEKGQCNPQRLDVLGGKFVGGFKNLIHGRDTSQSIGISIAFDKENYVGQAYSEVIELLGAELNFHHNSPSEYQTAKLDFEISWSMTANTAYISSYKISLDGAFAAFLNSDPGLKQPIIENINYLHPLLLPQNHDDWLYEQFDHGGEVHLALEEQSLNLKGYNVPSHRDIKQGADWPSDDNEDWPLFTDTAFVSEFHELITDSRLTSRLMADANLVESDTDKYLHIPLGFKGNIGAIPILGQTLQTSLELGTAHYTAMVQEILSDTIVSPLDDLLSLLKSSLSIGPLRNIPDTTFRPNPYPQQSDWHNGIAAWDVLAQADLSLLKKIDKWIRDENHLNLGYGIALKVEKQFAEFKKVSSIDSYEKVKKQLDSMITDNSFYKKTEFEFDEKKTDYKYALWDDDNRIDVLPSDIGVGVSQLMPLVVAALSRKKGIIAIEQPELHVHPRVQVAIADLLTQMDGSTSFLIETHSEHLILRLLRRIRETSYQENLLDKEVTPEDVSVVYLNPSDEGVKVIHYEVTSEGDFTKDWPQGFFEERYEEQ